MLLKELTCIILMMSITFPLSPSPYHASIIILISLMTISLVISELSSLWLSMILVIVMMGGFMILLFYIISLTKLSYHKFLSLPSTFTVMTLPLLYSLFDPHHLPLMLPISSINQSMSMKTLETMIASPNSTQMFSFIIILLLVILIIIVMMLKKEKNSLRVFK